MNVDQVINKIFDRYAGEIGSSIQILLDVQQEFNWIPKEAISKISERLQVPTSQIYRIASFYKVLSLKPRGRHLVQVCLGTACHVRGGQRIFDKTKMYLKVEEGETTEDGRFTLLRVNCLGCCALGPVVVIDKDYHGKVKVVEVEKILENYQ